MLQHFFDIYGYSIYIYTLILMLIYLLLIFFAWKDIFHSKDTVQDDIIREIIGSSPYAPGVSIIVPAYNEENTIIENAFSLLGQDYPKFEVIIVNDGSKDSTLEKLISNFDLEEVPFYYVEHIHTRPFKRLFKSKNPEYSRLTVVDKENGGTKADPINTGLNIASYPYFVNTDVDCILTRDAVYQCVMPILTDSSVIAVSAMMTMSNGCTVENGVITKLDPPKKLIPLFQELEYLRSFIVGKIGWSHINAMSNVSGGFGFFNRDIVINAGGYSTDSFAEDMDVLAHIVGYCCENHIPYKVVQIPRVCCRTEGPNNLRNLIRQRIRWGRGLIQTFHRHWNKVFNRHYGRMGLLAYPYVLIFELVAPIIEFTGYFVLLYLILTGGVNWETSAIIFIAAYLYWLLIVGVIIIFAYESRCAYPSLRSYIRLALAGMFEPIIYHPWITLSSIRGYFDYITGKKAVWKTIERKGYESKTKKRPENPEQNTADEDRKTEDKTKKNVDSNSAD